MKQSIIELSLVFFGLIMAFMTPVQGAEAEGEAEGENGAVAAYQPILLMTSSLTIALLMAKLMH